MCFGAIWYAGIRRVIFGSTIAEMQPFSKWPDLALPETTIRSLTNGAFHIRGGILKEQVVELYQHHPFRNKKE